MSRIQLKIALQRPSSSRRRLAWRPSPHFGRQGSRHATSNSPPVAARRSGWHCKSQESSFGPTGRPMLASVNGAACSDAWAARRAALSHRLQGSGCRGVGVREPAEQPDIISLIGAGLRRAPVRDASNSDSGRLLSLRRRVRSLGGVDERRDPPYSRAGALVEFVDDRQADVYSTAQAAAWPEALATTLGRIVHDQDGVLPPKDLLQAERGPLPRLHRSSAPIDRAPSSASDTNCSSRRALPARSGIGYPRRSRLPSSSSSPARCWTTRTGSVSRCNASSPVCGRPAAASTGCSTRSTTDPASSASLTPATAARPTDPAEGHVPRPAARRS